MDNQTETIVLLGFMGTGKSTVGRNLAKALEWDFIDTDQEIEKLTEMKVSDIFRKFGQMRFRSEEVLLVKRLKDKKHCVIATGGGTMLSSENWVEIAEKSMTIALYAPLDEIYRRIGHRNDRPLLRGDKEEVRALWNERQPTYNRADYSIDTTNKEVTEVVAEILKIFKGGMDHGAKN